MQTLGEQQRTLAALEMSLHMFEAVDKQSIFQYITIVDVKIMHVNRLYNYAIQVDYDNYVGQRLFIV